jgi:Mg2+ and Co2+ transporter CorA
MAQQSNGHDIHTETTVEDIKEIAGRIREQSISVVERVSDSGEPFQQQTHTLMTESVDRITQQWVAELNRVRDNTKVIEQMVIAQAAKTKDELTRLHLLGVQAMKEAQRGNDVAQRLTDELEAMMAENVLN